MDEFSREEISRTQVEIEKPELADIPRILELLSGQDAFHNDLDAGYYVEPQDEERIKQFRDDAENAIRRDDPTKRIRIARINGTIVGFVTYGIGEEEYLDTKRRRYVEIKELFVEESARKHGVGRRLRNEAMDLAKQNGMGIKVQYSVHNEGARKFWGEIASPSQEIVYSDPPKSI